MDLQRGTHHDESSNENRVYRARYVSLVARQRSWAANNVRALTFCAALASTNPTVYAGAAVAQACGGDCNGDGSVTVDEIILGARIALEDVPLDHCGALDGDGNGAVGIGELIAAVNQALHGCGGTNNEEIRAASVRVATEPLFRLFDFQAHIGTPGGVAGRSVAPGCQQFDCVAFGQITGTEEDCCSERLFTQAFDNCGLEDDLGRFVSLTGAFVLFSDSPDVCTGAIPVGTNFTAMLSSFTHDVFFPDGSFSRTFQELSETFQVKTGGCNEGQLEPPGFDIRGDGRRLIDGELEQFQTDGSGNVLLDSVTDVHRLAIEVGSTGEPNDCTVTTALRGSVTSSDFRAGTQFSTDLTDLQIVQLPPTGTLLLELNGSVGTDCLGEVTLSTVEPLRVEPGDTCFTVGRLDSLFKGTASTTYTESGLDLDFGADGSVEQHFPTCTDVPATDKCSTIVVGLCGACTMAGQCQVGLSCFPCSRDCSGDTARCSLANTFATCEDGVF